MQPLQLSRCLLVVCLLGGWLSVRPQAAAAALDDAPGTHLYAFGLHLFQLGEYYRATTELQRFTLLFPGHRRSPVARLLIGLALQEDGLYDDALSQFQKLRQVDASTDVDRVAAFKLGELRFLQQRYPQAIEQFQDFLRLYPGGPLVPRTTYLLGLAWALEHDTDRARQTLEALPSEHALAEPALALQGALQTTPADRPPSPRTAGMLAGMLPGAGHLYMGKPVQALTALLLNGLFLAGAVYAFHEGLEATGAILLYFETGWYLGNIKSAADGARDAIRQRQRAFFDHLRDTYALPPLSLKHLQAPALGLRLSF